MQKTKTKPTQQHKKEQNKTKNKTTPTKISQQFFSSLPSLQSGSPSQRHFLCMHSPEPHCISLGEHLAGGVGLRPQRSGDSSDWSWQSTSSSHSQLLGMHVLFPQGTSLGPQEDGAQSCSSLPSPQSSSPLQTKLRDTQRPLAQVNSRGAHVMLPNKTKENV